MGYIISANLTKPVDPRRTQAFLSRFGPIRQHFALPRHRMKAACHRAELKARLIEWYDWAGVQFPSIS